MNEIEVSKNKIVLNFSEEKLALIGNALNEVCNGIGVSEFDSNIGVSIEEAEIFLKIINFSYRKSMQLRIQAENDF